MPQIIQIIDGVEKGTGGASLTIEEQDASPSVSDVTKIKFDNGTVTDDGGGEVTVAIKTVIDGGNYLDPPGDYDRTIDGGTYI